MSHRSNFRPNSTAILGSAVLSACLGILFLTTGSSTKPATHHCGVERWPVKVGTDADAARVILIPKDTTIRDLNELQAPANPDSYRAKRFTGEFQTYRVHATMTLIKREADQDYHIVLNDGALTMIVESPDPQCAKNSQFTEQISNVRRTLDAKFGTFHRLPLSGHTLKIPVTVTGILFYDKIHGQEGVARNGVELHPITAIEFR